MDPGDEAKRLRAVLSNVEWILRGDRTDEAWINLYAYVRRELKTKD